MQSRIYLEKVEFAFVIPLFKGISLLVSLFMRYKQTYYIIFTDMYGLLYLFAMFLGRINLLSFLRYRLVFYKYFLLEYNHES